MPTLASSHQQRFYLVIDPSDCQRLPSWHLVCEAPGQTNKQTTIHTYIKTNKQMKENEKHSNRQTINLTSNETKDKHSRYQCMAIARDINLRAVSHFRESLEFMVIQELNNAAVISVLIAHIRRVNRPSFSHRLYEVNMAHFNRKQKKKKKNIRTTFAKCGKISKVPARYTTFVKVHHKANKSRVS
jgi:hypothetical protein